MNKKHRHKIPIIISLVCVPDTMYKHHSQKLAELCQMVQFQEKKALHAKYIVQNSKFKYQHH